MASKRSAVTREHINLTAGAGRQKIFCFKDEKSDSYGPPMTSPTKGMFIRQVQDELRAGQAIWAKHPHDFSIFELGEYDIYSGNIQLHESKKCIGLVLDFRDSQGQ